MSLRRGVSWSVCECCWGEGAMSTRETGYHNLSFTFHTFNHIKASPLSHTCIHSCTSVCWHHHRHHHRDHTIITISTVMPLSAVHLLVACHSPMPTCASLTHSHASWMVASSTTSRSQKTGIVFLARMSSFKATYNCF